MHCSAYTMCCLGLTAGGLSALVLAYFESRYSRDRALQTPLHRSTAQQPSRKEGGQLQLHHLPSHGSLASSPHPLVRSPVSSPPPRCVAQRVGQPQIHRSLSLSSTVSPTKRYLCLWSCAKAYFWSLLGILTQELLSLRSQFKHSLAYPSVLLMRWKCRNEGRPGIRILCRGEIFMLLFFFAVTLSEALNVMQTLCRVSCCGMSN